MHQFLALQFSSKYGLPLSLESKKVHMKFMKTGEGCEKKKKIPKLPDLGRN